MLTIGNGADGVIYNLGMAVLDQDDEALIPRISYPIYESIVRVMRARVTYTAMKGLRIDLEDLARRIGPRTKVVFLCNPNNPTGDALPRAELLAFLKSLPPKVLAVLDEAYVDFADPECRPGAVALVKGGMRNLFVLRTFSKLYGLAGARVGYGVGDPQVVELIHRIKPPFGVSALAERLALAALEDCAVRLEDPRGLRAGEALLLGGAGPPGPGLRALPYQLRAGGHPARLPGGVRAPAGAWLDRAPCRAVRPAELGAHHDRATQR